MAAASSGRCISDAPSPFVTIFFAGQPMLMSMTASAGPICSAIQTASAAIVAGS